MLETAIVVPHRLRPFFPDLNRWYPDSRDADRVDESVGMRSVPLRVCKENDDDNDRIIAVPAGRGACAGGFACDCHTVAASADRSGRNLSQQADPNDRAVCRRRWE